MRFIEIKVAVAFSKREHHSITFAAATHQFSAFCWAYIFHAI